jgi:uracil phosphoribosyltransferase
MVTVLSSQTSVVSDFLRELRDTKLQLNQRQFERNLERIGIIAGYEASKRLAYTSVMTTTPLADAETEVLDDKIVLATILRAGLPLQRGVQTVFDSAELAFIAAGRKPETPAGVEIDLSYVAGPRLDDKVLIIADTMLATGKSLVDTYRALTTDYGSPVRTIIICVIASQPGVTYVSASIPNVEIIAGAVDPKLDDNFFIVPGLGDAGDLTYGPKASKQ